MVTLNEYHSLDEFDDKRRQALESLLYSDEQFLYAIDVYDAIFLAKKRASKLVLTNQRVIAFKKAFIKETSKDFSIDEIASIEHNKGYVMRKISLEGHGFSEEYQTLEDFGRGFVTAVREQKHRNEEGLDPVDKSALPQQSDSGTAQTAAVSKYGSLKAHLLIAVLTIWWTAGIGNVLYAAFKNYQYRSADDTSEDDTENPASR